MSNLLELQRRVAAIVMQPLTSQDGMRRKTREGRSMKAEAEALIKPNRVLSSFERLEIYNRQYWFRVLSCFAEDFPGLRSIIGSGKFERLMRAYLTDCPSLSFTLRNLGSRLEAWLRSNPQWIVPRETLALDMVRLEWAHIEAFDGGYEPKLTLADIESAGLELPIALQPYIRLLELTYPADDLLIEVHDEEVNSDTSSNAARTRQLRNRVRRYAQPDPERIYLAVHRMEDSVYYKRLQLESFRMLSALSKQMTLEQALEIAFESSSMPEEERIIAVQRWFANWAELGWFCRPTLRLVQR
ncbi:MAG TPA: putative DNA-binding domain-containing protein [Chthoniobacterales bacterium]|nr:putative DNA-binding domain-containing protein [Chthoniobacterales bacterium]